MIPRAIYFCALRIPLVVLVTAIMAVMAMRVSAQLPPTTGSPVAAPSASPVEVIPPVPTHWFSDYANTTSPIFAIELDRRLERFEHETSDQFLVVIFPKMQTDASMDDYCLRTFNSWHVGQKGVNNGVILFVFIQDHKMRIEVGCGLENPLTNPVCQEIVKTIASGFKTGDFEGGLTNGVEAVVKTLRTQPVNRTAP